MARPAGAHRRRLGRPGRAACWSRCGSAPSVAIPSGPVLLVDDTTRTGWTLTVAAALLAEAGAGAVWPLVVHRLP